MSEQKFNIGDKVEVTRSIYPINCPIGTVAPIVERLGADMYTILKPDGKRWPFKHNEIKAVPASETMSDTLGTNPKDLLGAKKTNVHLVPPASTIYQALAMEDGAKKYGPYNWRENKVIASIYVSACMRHIYQWLDGEEVASDSKKPHLGHALACLGIIVDALETGNLIDDRPTKGAASDLIAKFEKKDK